VIAVMGARDDTLSEFAQAIAAAVSYNVPAMRGA